VAVVQAWVTNPSANKGFILAGGSNSDGVDVSSGNATTTSQRPRLTITYSTADSGTGTVTLLTAGDIAQGDGTGGIHSYTRYTGQLLDRLVAANPGALIAPLGDTVYPGGQEPENYYLRYYEPTWGGTKKALARPALGNHDYYRDDGSLHVEPPQNYFNYFGTWAGARTGSLLEGWYSYDFGSWHIIVLNSMCQDGVSGRCSQTRQMDWLRADLAANAGKKCTLAYWHHPINTSTKRYANRASWGYPEDNALEFYKALYDANADVILTGHTHWYERLAPLRWDDTADSARGLRQFVVGTGGMAGDISSGTHPQREAAQANIAGILELKLASGGYSWKYHSALSWKTWTDTGTASCH
jgi:hypothetical protein